MVAIPLIDKETQRVFDLFKRAQPIRHWSLAAKVNLRDAINSATGVLAWGNRKPKL